MTKEAGEIMKEEDYLEELEQELAEKYSEGRELLDRARLEEAEELLLAVREEAPDFAPVYNKLAVLEIYRKNYEKSRELLEETLRIDGEFSPALTNLGSLYREEGDSETARKYYQRAIELDPDYGPAYNNLGVIYREEGNYSESIKNLKKANKLKSYTVAHKDRPIYKEPGCLIPLAIVALVFIIFYLLR